MSVIDTRVLYLPRLALETVYEVKPRGGTEAENDAATTFSA